MSMTISPCGAGASPVPTPVAEINGRYQGQWRLSSESRCMTNPTRVRRKSTFVDTFDPGFFGDAATPYARSAYLLHEARSLRKLCRQNTFHHFKLRAFSWRKRLLD